MGLSLAQTVKTGGTTNFIKQDTSFMDTLQQDLDKKIDLQNKKNALKGQMYLDSQLSTIENDPNLSAEEKKNKLSSVYDNMVGEYKASGDIGTAQSLLLTKHKALDAMYSKAMDKQNMMVSLGVLDNSQYATKQEQLKAAEAYTKSLSKPEDVAKFYKTFNEMSTTDREKYELQQSVSKLVIPDIQKIVSTKTSFHSKREMLGDLRAKYKAKGDLDKVAAIDNYVKTNPEWLHETKENDLGLAARIDYKYKSRLQGEKASADFSNTTMQHQYKMEEIVAQSKANKGAKIYSPEELMTNSNSSTDTNTKGSNVVVNKQDIEGNKKKREIEQNTLMKLRKTYLSDKYAPTITETATRKVRGRTMMDSNRVKLNPNAKINPIIRNIAKKYGINLTPNSGWLNKDDVNTLITEYKKVKQDSTGKYNKYVFGKSTPKYLQASFKEQGLSPSMSKDKNIKPINANFTEVDKILDKSLSPYKGKTFTKTEMNSIKKVSKTLVSPKLIKAIKTSEKEIVKTYGKGTPAYTNAMNTLYGTVHKKYDKLYGYDFVDKAIAPTVHKSVASEEIADTMKANGIKSDKKGFYITTTSVNNSSLKTMDNYVKTMMPQNFSVLYYKKGLGTKDRMELYKEFIESLHTDGTFDEENSIEGNKFYLTKESRKTINNKFGAFMRKKGYNK